MVIDEERLRLMSRRRERGWFGDKEEDSGKCLAAGDD